MFFSNSIKLYEQNLHFVTPYKRCIKYDWQQIEKRLALEFIPVPVIGRSEKSLLDILESVLSKGCVMAALLSLKKNLGYKILLKTGILCSLTLPAYLWYFF